jgi:hypothetical protein
MRWGYRLEGDPGRLSKSGVGVARDIDVVRGSGEGGMAGACGAELPQRCAAALYFCQTPCSHEAAIPSM